MSSVAHAVGVGDTPRRRHSVFRWALWELPTSARAFLLALEALAVAVSVTLLVRETVTADAWLRAGVLAALGIGYAEAAQRVDRFKRYLGGNVIGNQVGLWSFAGALALPAGLAAALAGVLYGHVLVQRHRDCSGYPHRTVFSAATVVVAVVAASAIVHSVPGDVLSAGLLPTLAVVAALLTATTVNLGLLVIGMWLAVRPPSVRTLLPGADAVGYQLATLVVGVMTAELLITTPVLTPIVLVVVAYLHRASLVKALDHAARTDSKTGLLNSAAWRQHAASAVSRCARSRASVAVLLLDIDRFKAINDTHGHLVGDQVLATVVACLRRELRGHDGLGRFGGDEFVVIVEGIDRTDAEAIADRLRRSIRATSVQGVEISASIGLAHAAAADTPDFVDALLSTADAALYAAKAAGRGRIPVTD